MADSILIGYFNCSICKIHSTGVPTHLIVSNENYCNIKESALILNEMVSKSELNSKHLKQCIDKIEELAKICNDLVVEHEDRFNNIKVIIKDR